MINRRRILQSIFSFTAGCAAIHTNSTFGDTSKLQSTSKDSAQLLVDLLQDAIQLCGKIVNLPHHFSQSELVQTRNLCQLAIARVQHSADNSPAFWQACSDSIIRLEVAVSARVDTDFQNARFSFVSLYRLRDLREQLVVRTVQAIGGPSRLA